MLSPAEVGFDLSLYAQVWLEERLRLTRALAQVVADKPKPEAVHDVRVACRRLREAIEFFRGVPEVPPLSDVDRAARALARSVRRLRELDVAQKRLSQLAIPGSPAKAMRVRDELVESLQKRRRRARKKDLPRIVKRAAAFAAAVDEILPLRSKLRAIESDRTRESHLLAFVEARVAEKRALVENLVDDVRLSDSAPRAERLHAVRVAVKHWRYSTEIARAVMPRVLYRPLAVRLRRLQEIGGKGQDFADLEHLVASELTRAQAPARSGRPILLRIRASRRAAAAEFVAALGSNLPTAQAAGAG